MLSQVGIANAALAKLGAGFIIDLTDDTREARAANEAFPRVRDALLRAHRWSFAMTRVQLAALASVPTYLYRTQYQLPVDLLRLDYVGDLFVGLEQSDFRNSPAADYAIEGRLLLTDLAQSGSTLGIRYVKRVTDTTQFDPLFDEALACKLAVELANTLTQSDTLKDIAAQEFKATVRSAVRTNAIEKPPEPIPDDGWLLSRI